MAKAKESAYDKMSLEDLQDEQQRLDKERRELKAEMMELAAVLDKRLAEAELQRRFAGMNSAELEALRQLVKSNGIQSAEEFGEPGR